MFIDEYGRKWRFKPDHDTAMMLQVDPKVLWAALQLRDTCSYHSRYTLQFVEDGDCYLLRMPDGEWHAGIRHSNEPSDYLSPYLDDRLLDYMVTKHRSMASLQEYRAITAIDRAYPLPSLDSEVWAVIGKRGDGRLPDPIKSMCAPGEQWVHHYKQEAVVAKEAVNTYLGGNFAGVFRCLLRVISDETETPTKE